ncbi:MAG: endospore germination permease [Paenibacillus macerans]|nr:endospore germination permease [Paenibacillus macerans]KFN07964.1 spore germination family protein [Paenibacillus macerans]MBS5909836.1 endospore germination permease [Paenibacillus macerans]MCY7556833.1 spore germination protein [Paenibacillus macerans]MDU7475158.1 endospore germination permease [Paenibacillus macerans]MEC0136479.1 endospore germination permease [Paenibacillus macerans]
MQSAGKISTIQLAVVISSTIFGSNVLSFPKIMAESAGTAAPLITVAGTAFAAVSLFIFAILSQRFSDRTIYDYSRNLIGKWPAFFINSLVLAVFLITTALGLRHTGEVLSTVVFRQTPIEMSILLMLLLVAFSCRRNVLKFCYVHIFYWPFVITPFLFLFLVSAKSINPLNLMPLLGNEPADLVPSLFSSASLYLGSFIIAILLPVTEKPKKALKASVIAISVAGGMYLLIIISALGIYGVEETKLLLYPTLEVARSIELGGQVIERFDAIFIIMWVINIYSTLYSGYYLSAYSLCELLRVKDQRMTSTLLIPVFFGISMLPNDLFQLYEISRIADWSSYIFLTGYGLLLLAVSLVRRGRRT